jgi:hypothetical protein
MPYSILRSLPVAVALTASALLSAPLSAQVREAGAPPPRGAPTTSQPTAPLYATHEDRPTATAVRTQATISIDGRLDEAAWAAATPVTDFWQVTPDEATPVSERTAVRFLYDDDALYVGAWLYDTDGTIVRRLARRDTGVPDVDLFSIHLDSYHSHRSSNRFVVTASGSIQDRAAGAGDRLTGGDASWNPVWDARTTITDEGWFAEIRIPFSQLRFSQADEQVWGLQIERKIRPSEEETVWSFTPTTEPTGQITFGHLVGISGIRPGRKLELLPYAGGSAEYVDVAQSSEVSWENPFRSGSDYFGNAGLDLKYKVTSNLTLDGTVNPDFGQVEVDPAVINLTAFETRFEERRPFFVEGAEIFQFGDRGAQLFYSRRIGRPPRGSAPGAAVYDLTPNTTTILGAGKLTGKTANGWSLAVLEAVTSREHATWRDTANVERELEVEPLANYFAGRARREMRGGQSHVGALLTTVHRSLDGSPLVGSTHATAYSGGLDFSHDFAERAWHLAGSFSPSYVTGGTASLIATQRSSSRYYQRPDADYLEVDSSATSLYGYTAEASIAKQRGLWRFDAAASAVSPGYEINDLGFSTTADRITARGSLAYVQTQPGPLFRSWNVRVSPELAWNYGRDLIGSSTGISGSVVLPNFWSLNARATVNPRKLNQRLTRGGPLARDPFGYSASLGFGNASAARVRVSSNVSYGEDRSGAWSRGIDANLSLRVGEHLEAQLGPSFEQSFGTAQYVTSRADPLATRTFGRRYIFADLRQNTVSMNARLNITLSPRMTIEVFAQPLISSGDYGDLKELRAPRTFQFDRYGSETGTMTALDGGRRYRIDPDAGDPTNAFTENNRDFNVRELRSNAVFRWEWRPGSTLFLVWQQTRSGELDASDPDSPLNRVGNFSFGRDAGDLFDLHPDNILLIKASYWLNP